MTLFVTILCVVIRDVFWKMYHGVYLPAKPCAVILGSPSVLATNEWLECTDEDRRARRRKLGLPEELTDKEKAQEAAAAAQKAEVAKKKNSFVSVKPVSGRLLLASIQSQHKIQAYRKEKCATFGTASCSCVAA